MLKRIGPMTEAAYVPAEEREEVLSYIEGEIAFVMAKVTAMSRGGWLSVEKRHQVIEEAAVRILDEATEQPLVPVEPPDQVVEEEPGVPPPIQLEETWQIKVTDRALEKCRLERTDAAYPWKINAGYFERVVDMIQAEAAEIGEGLSEEEGDQLLGDAGYIIKPMPEWVKMSHKRQEVQQSPEVS